jgi:predicted metalloendopeptidase
MVLGALSAVGRATAAQVAGFDRSFIDTTCSPCRDFYQYANGAWLDTASFPAAHNTIGVRRDMEERVAAAAHRILEGAADSVASAPSPLGIFYQGCMDSTGANRLGHTAIAEELRRLSGITTRRELGLAIEQLQVAGIRVPFMVWREPDPKAPVNMIAVIYQAGLQLPDRDYYLLTDSASVALRRGYRRFVERTFRLLGMPGAAAKNSATRVIALETKLASASMTLLAQRDPDSTYHMMTVRELTSLAPAIDWMRLFSRSGITSLASPDGSLDIAQPAFLREVSALMQKEPLETWRAYLTWQHVAYLNYYLGDAMFREAFGFERLLSGAEEPMPRSRRCAEAAGFLLPDAIWQSYVTSYLDPTARARVTSMTESLRAALRARMTRVAWMDDSTRIEAQAKLGDMRTHVAYPDTWRDYASLGLSLDDPFPVNLMRVMGAEQRRQLAKIGGPVDRDDWGLSAMTVDAFYDPSLNGTFILPGMLQPPRFDPAIDDAVLYGSLGTLIGHELTHGFDDQGRRYDRTGNLRDWWTADAARQFTDLSGRVVRQYSAFIAIDTLRVNGELTLGENIADIGGLAIAFDAFTLAAAGSPDIDGFTPAQRFLLGYAQGWRRLYRPETMRLRALTDPHAPPAVRINASLMNLEAFALAFGCKPGDAMVAGPDSRIRIW